MSLPIVASGMVCGVGLTAPAACAAMRAGATNFLELPYWDCNNVPVVGCMLPDTGGILAFQPRLTNMLALALQDCMSRFSEPRVHKIPLLVALAEPGRPGGETELAGGMIALVQEMMGLTFHPQYSTIIPGGHAAGFEGLRMARELLRSTDVPGCLVCGVDSYVNASSILWLDRHWRLKREGHTDGVIPGEAAAAVYVTRQSSNCAALRAELVALGFSEEQTTVLSDDPLLGTGLARAAQYSLAEAGWGFHEVDLRLSDVTGENYGFREHALAVGKLTRVVRSDDQPLWHAADSIGDVGAAAGVVQLTIAAAALTRGYAPGPRVACFTSSVLGERAVALLRRSES